MDAKPEDWKRIEVALKSIGLQAPETGDPQDTWVPLLADVIEKMAALIHEEYGPDAAKWVRDAHL